MYLMYLLLLRGKKCSEHEAGIGFIDRNSDTFIIFLCEEVLSFVYRIERNTPEHPSLNRDFVRGWTMWR